MPAKLCRIPAAVRWLVQGSWLLSLGCIGLAAPQTTTPNMLTIRVEQVDAHGNIAVTPVQTPASNGASTPANPGPVVRASHLGTVLSSAAKPSPEPMAGAEPQPFPADVAVAPAQPLPKPPSAVVPVSHTTIAQASPPMPNIPPMPETSGDPHYSARVSLPATPAMPVAAPGYSAVVSAPGMHQAGPVGFPPGFPGIPDPMHAAGPMPTELSKVSLPCYRVEPPDILLIDTLRMIPLPPYLIEPLDILIVTVPQTLPNQPIAGNYPVSPDGSLNLGFVYGSVRVAGMTLEKAEIVIRNHLRKFINDPQVSVSLGQLRAVQQTRGEHLVGPDGTISLGTYGDVYVAGMTRGEAKCAIERYLSRFLLNPEISLSIYAYNSKVYYVITDGGGYGQQVYRFPSTGNETVLDAISNISGLPAVASKRKIWVARPAPPGHPCDQVLPVDWNAIVEGGSTKTNYQIFPGDRIYVKADCLIAFDNTLAKIFAPIERVLGITLLGSTTVNSFRNNNNGNGAFIAVP